MENLQQSGRQKAYEPFKAFAESMGIAAKYALIGEIGAVT